MKLSTWKSRKRAYWSILVLSIMRPTMLIFIGLAFCRGFIPRVNSFDTLENARFMEQPPGRHPSMVDLYPSSQPVTRYGDISAPENSGRASGSKSADFYSRLVGSGDGTESIKTPIYSAGFAGGPWGRNWYPRAPQQGKPSKQQSSLSDDGMKMDKHGRVQMGVENKDCDDAKTNLTRDWDFSPVDYTCFHPETRFPLNTNLQPLLHCVNLPANYTPNHLCMDASITYADKIPTYGDHRPLWPKFGEYLYVPKQRWLHNIEHGAVVMLYHPCAHPEEVKQLKRLVTHCYGKHVITPDTNVDPERPLELVAWGCSLKMAVVDEPLVIKFIHEKSMNGPEGKYTKEGQFDFGLLRIANATKGSRYDRITCDSPVM